jgi:hypothetical protein
MDEELDDFENEIDKDVDSIISQLKDRNKSMKKAAREMTTLNKEDIEKFIIDNAAAVVTHSLEMIEDMKDITIAGGESEAIEAMAELVKATTGAIDSLSKLKLADDKIKAQKQLKEMDINSKKIGDSGVGASGIYISREELIKELVKTSSDPEKIEEPTIDV